MKRSPAFLTALGVSTAALAAGLLGGADGPALAATSPAAAPGSASPAATLAAVRRTAASGGDVNQVPGVGATVPFTEVQAEDARTNGTVLGPDWAYGTLAAESVGRRSVQLTRTGQYVEFTLTKAANAGDLRYSIPDSADGKGLDATLGVFVDGHYARSLDLTSRYSWYYGQYPWSNNPADGGRRQLFDDVRVLFGKTLPAGTKVRLQVRREDTAPSYTIDLADFEQVAAPAAQPAGSLSVTSFGADPTGRTDSSDAIQRALDAGRAQHRTVWLPAGTFTVTRHLIVDQVTLTGAGQWYSVLHGAGVGVYGRYVADGASRDVHLSDFAILGEVTERVDSDQVNGIGGALNDSTVDDVWIQHTKVGLWLDGPFDNLKISRVRILDQTADGINFHDGVTNSSVTDTYIRNTGDDGLAMWSDTNADAHNTFAHNTVAVPTLANTIAIYGGRDNSVADNLVMDTVTEGGGVQVANRFGAVPLAGTTTVTGNVLERTGSLGLFSHIGWGALWFWAGDYPMTGRVEVTDNVIADSAYEAMQAYGSSVSNVHLTGDVVSGTGTFAAQLNAAGSATVDRTRASRIATSAAIYDCDSGFRFTGTGNTGLSGTTCGYPAPGPLQLSAQDLSFQTDGVGHPSDPQTVTVTNPTGSAQRIASVTTTGAYRLTTTCPALLPPHTSCAVTMVFDPTPAGDHTGALTVSDGTSAGRYQVYVTGKVVTSTVGNLAAGQPATATSAVEGFPASTVTDSNTDTYWESASDAYPQNLTVDLGSTKTVARVQLKLNGGWGGRTERVEVRGSTDGSTFTTLAPAADLAFDPTANNNTVAATFAPTPVRYVRVVVTANSGWTAAQVAELEAYATTG